MTKPKPNRYVPITPLSPRYDPDTKPATPPLADFGKLPYAAISATERGILMAKKSKPAKKPAKGC